MCECVNARVCSFSCRLFALDSVWRFLRCALAVLNTKHTRTSLVARAIHLLSDIKTVTTASRITVSVCNVFVKIVRRACSNIYSLPIDRKHTTKTIASHAAGFIYAQGHRELQDVDDHLSRMCRQLCWSWMFAALAAWVLFGEQASERATTMMIALFSIEIALRRIIGDGDANVAAGFLAAEAVCRLSVFWSSWSIGAPTYVHMCGFDVHVSYSHRWEWDFHFRFASGRTAHRIRTCFYSAKIASDFACVCVDQRASSWGTIIRVRFVTDVVSMASEMKLPSAFCWIGSSKAFVDGLMRRL